MHGESKFLEIVNNKKKIVHLGRAGQPEGVTLLQPDQSKCYTHKKHRKIQNLQEWTTCDCFETLGVKMGPLPRKKTDRRKDRKWRTWKTPNRIISIGISCMLSLAKPRGQTLSNFWDWCIIWEKQVNAVGKHPSLLTRSSWGCAPSRSACEAGSTTPRFRSGCKSKADSGCKSKPKSQSYSACKSKSQSWMILSLIVIYQNQKYKILW